MKPLKPSSALFVKRGFLIIFAIGWLAMSCLTGVFFILPMLFAPSGTDRWTLLLPLLLEVPFIGVGVGLLVWGLLPLVARLRVTAPKVEISSDTLAIGEGFSVTYVQEFKNPVDVNLVRLRLLLRETSSYRRGTNTYTVTHEHVYDTYELPARRYEIGEQLYGRRDLEIPPGAMHSFSATRNKLEWMIHVHVGVAGWPDYNEEYLLNVRPELARRDGARG